MKHLADKYYIDADKDAFVVYERTTIKDKKSKNYGKEEDRVVGWYPTLDSVRRLIKDLGIKQYLNKDWLQCVEFVDEACVKLEVQMEELHKKRYGDRKNNR